MNINSRCGIYTITSPSGKQYVGSAKNFEKRWALHLHKLRKGAHHCPGLQHAFNKYGENALLFAVVESCPPEQLLAREQLAIDSRGFANLYNAAPIAGSRLGMRLSEATKARISAAHMGKIGRAWTDKQREALRVAHTGRERTAEHAAKLSAALKGRTLTEEFKAKLSAAHKGKTLTPEHRAKIAAGLKRAAVTPERRAEIGRNISAAKRAKKLEREQAALKA